MFNLKRYNGTFKGVIGECLFKNTNDNVIITKFFNKNKFFSKFDNIIGKEKRDFLFNNWFSIDAVEFDKSSMKIVLYEIKTRNKYNKELHFKPKMTLATHKIYTEALRIGFIVKIATVWLCDNWDYNVVLSDFDDSQYCIDKPKKWDKCG